MANFRIFYIERELKDPAFTDVSRALTGTIPDEYVGETEWEETYEGKNWEQAMDAFFRDHAPGAEVGIIEEDGTSRPVAVTEGWQHDRTYVWIEEGKLMLYQGLDESTPGMVACPLCDGAGEVDDATAEEFAAVWESDDEDAG